MTETASFQIDTVDNDPSTVVIRIGQYLDFRNQQVFREITGEQIDKGVRNLVLDFSETQSFDSAGFGSILPLLRKLDAPFDGKIIFAAASEPVKTMIQFTHAFKVFLIYPSVESACVALHQRQR